MQSTVLIYVNSLGLLNVSFMQPRELRYAMDRQSLTKQSLLKYVILKECQVTLFSDFMTIKHIGAFHRSMSFVFYSKQYSDEVMIRI